MKSILSIRLSHCYRCIFVPQEKDGRLRGFTGKSLIARSYGGVGVETVALSDRVFRCVEILQGLNTFISTHLVETDVLSFLSASNPLPAIHRMLFDYVIFTLCMKIGLFVDHIMLFDYVMFTPYVKIGTQ